MTRLFLKEIIPSTWYKDNVCVLMVECNGIYARAMHVGPRVITLRVAPDGGTCTLEEARDEMEIGFNGKLVTDESGDVTVATVGQLRPALEQWGWRITDPLSLMVKDKYMGHGAKPQMVREVTIKWH